MDTVLSVLTQAKVLNAEGKTNMDTILQILAYIPISVRNILHLKTKSKSNIILNIFNYK